MFEILAGVAVVLIVFVAGKAVCKRNSRIQRELHLNHLREFNSRKG